MSVVATRMLDGTGGHKRRAMARGIRSNIREGEKTDGDREERQGVKEKKERVDLITFVDAVLSILQVSQLLVRWKLSIEVSHFLAHFSPSLRIPRQRME